jgi:hypothetical protein
MTMRPLPDFLVDLLFLCEEFRLLLDWYYQIEGGNVRSTLQSSL